MKHPKILKSLNSADDVIGYGADCIEVENSSFVAQEIL